MMNADIMNTISAADAEAQPKMASAKKLIEELAERAMRATLLTCMPGTIPVNVPAKLPRIVKSAIAKMRIIGSTKTVTL